MAEFNGKKGHWVTTESGAHIFIESGGSFDEAVEKAFGKENKGKYKKYDKVKEVIDKMTKNGTKEVNLNAGTISRASNGELTEEEVHKWFEENDELEDYEAFDDDNDFENWDDEEEEKNLSNILSKEKVRQDDPDHTSDDLEKIAKKYNVDINKLKKQWEKENVIFIE